MKEALVVGLILIVAAKFFELFWDSIFKKRKPPS